MTGLSPRPRIFVPRDAAALALGSDEVERAIVAAIRVGSLSISCAPDRAACSGSSQ
jgi:hypothetical protein